MRNADGHADIAILAASAALAALTKLDTPTDLDILVARPTPPQSTQ